MKEQKELEERKAWQKKAFIERNKQTELSFWRQVKKEQERVSKEVAIKSVAKVFTPGQDEKKKKSYRGFKQLYAELMQTSNVPKFITPSQFANFGKKVFNCEDNDQIKKQEMTELYEHLKQQRNRHYKFEERKKSKTKYLQSSHKARKHVKTLKKAVM